MNKSMLVGAVGLALAGVAVASEGARFDTLSVRSDVSTFAQMRDSVLGEAGSNRRANVLAQISGEIVAGNIDPRTVVFALTEELMKGSTGGAAFFGGTEGGLGANAQCFDDFSSPSYALTNFTNPPTSLVSATGQLNACGQQIAANSRYGIATDAVMMNNGGGPGGVPPMTQPAGGEPYMVFARETGLGPIINTFSLGMNFLHDLYVPNDNPATGHIRLATDWYLTEAETSQWWSPVSFTEGFVFDRMFFGGTELGGALGFAQNGQNVLDNFVSLGVLAGNFTIGQFYAPPQNGNFPFPVNKWFTTMAVMTQAPGGGIGQGMFIKTPDTVLAGFLDPRMASGDIIPSDKIPAGWVNTYPGIEDDPLTVGVIEGIGFAQTQFGELAPINGAFGLSTIFAAISASGMQFGIGNDPTAAEDPNYLPADAFIDNYIAKGTEFEKPCPLPDFILPYTDTFELYAGGDPVRLQTDLLIDNISSNSIISTLQNTTPGGTQSIAQQNINNDNLYRQEFGTNLPNFPAKVWPNLGDDGLPFTMDANEGNMVFQARIRLGGSTRTGRALRITDAAEFGNFTATVLLGGTDPTGGFAAADGRVWVRQPNVGIDGVWGEAPGYNESEDAEDNLIQANWIPELQWALVPTNAPFNTTFTNVRAGASGNAMGQAVTANTFHTVRVEVQHNPGQDDNNQFDEGVMRIFFNGTELFPGGDSSQTWLAGSVTATDASFWSSNNTNGQLDTIHVDDIMYSGPLFMRVPGPAFALPYVDGFESYPLEETIDNHGDTPYVSLASIPDQQGFDFNRKLTILNSNSNVPVNGTLVCRYMVDLLCVDAPGGLAVGSVVALNHETLPLPYNTFLAANLDCPGGLAAATRFVTRPGENMPRVEEGEWILLNADPEPFDSVNGDIVSHDYSFTTLARWGVGGIDAAGLVREDPTEGVNAILQVESLFGVDGSLTNHPMSGIIVSTLPVAEATPQAFPNDAVDVVLEWDTYIESLDIDGMPDNTLAPRSRMEVPIFGSTGNGGRITRFMYGGPNVNAHANLQAQIPPSPIIDLDSISYAIPSGIDDPQFEFVDTGVSLISGGSGISGPLVNTWFTSRFTLRANGTWDYEIDEDRDGPAGFVLVASDTSIDQGVIGLNGEIVNTSSTDSFNVNIGQDLGSGGDPVVPPTRIRMINGPSTSNWDAVGPPNADPDEDYCFYSVNTEEFKDAGAPPKIALFNDDGTAQDTTPPDSMIDTRDLGAANDVIAVINRAVNGSNMVFGPKLFEECPINNVTINQFELHSATGATVRYRGRWALMGQVGQAGVNNPAPAGGLTRPAGPSSMPRLAYNDHLQEPAGYPATPAAREIILARFGEDAADPTLGVDPIAGVFPRSRWYFDNVDLSETGGGAPCASIAGDPNTVDGADLAQLLTNWHAAPNPPMFGNSADYNGDGFVNGTDLAILLTNWGPCP